MKTTLFNQFVKEIKKVEKININLFINCIDTIYKNTDSSSLKCVICNITDNFNYLILNCRSNTELSNCLLKKYTDKETFKNDLKELKNLLTNLDNINIEDFKVESKNNIEKENIIDSDDKVYADFCIKVLDVLGDEKITKKNIKDKMIKLFNENLIQELFKLIGVDFNLNEFLNNKEEINEFINNLKEEELNEFIIPVDELNNLIKIGKSAKGELNKENNSNSNKSNKGFKTVESNNKNNLNMLENIRNWNKAHGVK